jgi:hypothetical protein
VERRREQVASFAARGFSVRQIAVALQVSKDAVHRDLKAVRPILRRALADKAEDIYADAAAELEEVRRELWLGYGSVPTDQVGLRAALLMDIAALPERRARLGQSLGLVLEAPKKIEIGAKFDDFLAALAMHMTPEGHAELARAMRSLHAEYPKLLDELLVR